MTKTKTKANVSEHDFSRVTKLHPTLINMLLYRRPSRKQNDPVYREFLETYVEPLFGAPDELGNYLLVIGNDGKRDTADHPMTAENMPRICYTAHHDTVHSNVGKQSGRLFYNVEPLSNTSQAMMNIPTASTDTYIWITNPPVVYETKDVVVKKWNGDLKVLEDKIEQQKILVKDSNDSSCLGADCTTGVWLIREMILKNCPGVYMIFADEEVGGIGSRHIANQYTSIKAQVDGLSKFPLKRFDVFKGGWANVSFEERKQILPFSYWIDHVQIVMSFDRKNIGSIISRQSGGTCVSPEFVDDLSDILSPMLIAKGYKELTADTGGTFTDSASFMKLIPECTNLSVGYISQHTERESQNFSFAVALRQALIANAKKLNNSMQLRAMRDPNAVEKYNYTGYGSSNYGTGYGNSNYGTSTYSSPKALAPPAKDTDSHKRPYSDEYYDDWEKWETKYGVKSYVDDAENDTIIASVVDKFDEEDTKPTLPPVGEEEYEDDPDEVLMSCFEQSLEAHHDTIKIPLNEFVNLVDECDQDIDTFIEYVVSIGGSLQGYTQFSIDRELQIEQMFKQRLVEQGIDPDDQSVIDFLDTAH